MTRSAGLIRSSSRRGETDNLGTKQMMRLMLALALAAASSPTAAQFFYGDDLRKMCDAKTSASIAYVSGAVDAAFFYQKLRGVKDRICMPMGVKTDQVLDVACKYLEDHPENRHWIAADIVAESVAQAWPCPK